MKCFVLSLRGEGVGTEQGQGQGLGREQGWQAHLQDTQTQLCRGLQTRLQGPSAWPLGNSSQGDRAHSLPMMLPPALSERCPVGRERHLEPPDTSGLEDTGGLRRKRDLGQKQQAEKG